MENDVVVDSSVLKSILREVGTPTIVLSEALLLAQANAFIGAAREHLPANHAVFYSVKTNDVLPAVASVARLVDGLEVISEVELDLVTKLDPAPSIIVNGPNKSESLLRQAILAGARCINIDSLADAKRIERLAQDMRCSVRVGLRIAAPKSASWSQFGLALDGSEMHDIMQLLVASKYLKFYGVHYHGEHFFERAGDVSHLMQYIMHAKRFLEFRLGPLRSINLGGGWEPTLRLNHAHQWVADNSSIDLFKQIGNAWTALGKGAPHLILEPGRALVEGSCIALTSVGNVKSHDNRRFSFLDLGTGYMGGRHVCEACICYAKLEHEFTYDDALMRQVLCGPLCYGSDILSTVDLPELRAGDVVTMANAGAYTLTLRWHGSAPVPRIIWLAANGQWQTLDSKGAQTCSNAT